LPNRRVVVDVLHHHLQHGRETEQSKKRWIESMPLCGLDLSGAGEVRVLRQPVVNVENLLWIGGGRRNLSQQRIGIKRDRRQQLI
jgi:hypothetical protein